MTIKAEAETLRLELLLGLTDHRSIVAWADEIILADRAAQAPMVFDLSLGADKPVAELATLLGQVPGEVDRAAVGRRVASRLRGDFVAGRLDVVAVARAMYRLTLEGYAPDSEFESMAYYADDGADLALQGTYGTLDDLRQQVVGFLDRYVSHEQP